MFHLLSAPAAQLVAAAKPGLIRSTRRWIYSLGGIGFLPLGLLDASIIPLPGSMDVLTIVLCARRPELWPYYAFMATLGSVVGSWAMYRLARKSGNELLERKLSARRVKQVEEAFSRWGFGAIALPALLPPPVPMVPFVMTAGAMGYPTQKFLLAITLGRAGRFTLLGFLAERYGRGIMTFVTKHSNPVIATGVVVIVLGALTWLVAREMRKHPARESSRRSGRAAGRFKPKAERHA